MSIKLFGFAGLGLILVSGCVAQPRASSSTDSNTPIVKAINEPMLNIDSGDGSVLPENGRVSVSSYHAGLNRDKQVFCWEPLPTMPSVSFERFEYCLEYLNGVRSAQDYQSAIQGTYPAQPLSLTPN